MVGKKVNGRTYYYLAESARVDGRPRIVSQRYLGSADDIAAAVAGDASAPEHSRHLAFGDVAAVWATLERLGVARIADETAGGRAGQLPIGACLAVAVLHRLTGATTEIADWWPTTAAARFVRPRLPAGSWTAPRLWRRLDKLSVLEMERIEAELSAVVRDIAGGGVALAVDVPGFATFVASAEAMTAGTRATTLVGLGVVVTGDGAIPLVSRAYRRDVPVVASFGAMAEQLSTRHRGDVTLVFDTGQHSQLNLATGPHFVGALRPADFPELLSRPATARRAVDPRRFPGVTALDTRTTVFGVSRRVILTHSTTLHAAQARALAQALSTATRQLDGLAAGLAAGTYRQSRDELLTEIARITRVPRVDRVLNTRISADMRLEWQVDEGARARLEQEMFGKQLLVTDHDDWSVADVVTAYRARYHLDSTFRQLNEPFVTGPPAARWYWTDHRIAVFSLTNVIAATVAHVMRWEAHRAGFDLSVRELLEQLSGIQETQLRYPSTGGRPRTRRVLTDRDARQQQLFDLFGLSVYAPKV